LADTQLHYWLTPKGNSNFKIQTSKFKLQNSRIKFRTNFELINFGYKPPGEFNQWRVQAPTDCHFELIIFNFELERIK